MKKIAIFTILALSICNSSQAAYVIAGETNQKSSGNQANFKEELVEYRLPFYKGTSVFTKEALENLEQIKAMQSSTDSIVLVVRPDSRSANRQLATSRTNSLRNWLLKRNFDSSRLRFEIDESTGEEQSSNTVATYAFITTKPSPISQTRFNLSSAQDNGFISRPSQRQTENMLVSYSPSQKDTAIAPRPSSAIPAQPPGDASSLIIEMAADGRIKADDAIRMLSALKSTPQQQQVVTAATNRQWVLQANLTLQENLTNWTKSMGWNPPEWQIEDVEEFKITKTKTIQGDLPTVLGAIAKASGLRIAFSEKQRLIRVLPALEAS